MVGKLVRRLKEIDAEIRRESYKREKLRFSIVRKELAIAGCQGEIDRLTGPNILGYTIDNSSELRCTISSLANAIGECYLEIREYREEMDLCDLRIETLKEERELVSERLEELRCARIRELDVYDYQLMIDKNGFIRGTKL